MFLYEDILREFQKQKVKYVLVGGMACVLLGWLRNTTDMDILVEMSDNNLFKVAAILKRMGYKVKQPVDPMGIADKKIRKDWINNKNMKAFNFYKDDEFKEVDIIIESPVSFTEAKKHALYMKSGGITIPVASIGSLIKMKKNTGRNIDKIDVEELRRLKKLRNKK